MLSHHGVSVVPGSTGLDPGSVHIVFPSDTPEVDASDPEVAEGLLRARNLQHVREIREGCELVSERKGLSSDHCRALKSLISSGFVGSPSDLTRFFSERRPDLSSLDTRNGHPLVDVYGWASGMFVEGFFPRMMSTVLVGYPIMGPGELFLCAMTDYSRDPSARGDLVGSNGVCEVKAEGRLGGQRPDRDGRESKEAVYSEVRMADDGLKGWGAASYRALSERVRSRGYGRVRLSRVVRLMMNYDGEVDPLMVDSLVEDPQQFHAALHLHCYSSARGLGEVLFLTRDRLHVVSYRGTAFSEALTFSSRYLRNLGGWGGWNQDRSGVRVEASVDRA